MIGSKIIAIVFAMVLLLGFNLQSNNQIMEINEAISGKSIDSFIANKFDSVGASYKNPIFPYKINYKVKGNEVTFCGVPVIDCWALKSNSSYTFFLLVKHSPDLVNAISKNYGQHESETEIEINDRPSSPTSYSWEAEKVNIFLKSFRNVEKDKKYEGCSMVIIGNMSYYEIVSFPPLKSF